MSVLDVRFTWLEVKIEYFYSAKKMMLCRIRINPPRETYPSEIGCKKSHLD